MTNVIINETEIRSTPQSRVEALLESGIAPDGGSTPSSIRTQTKTITSSLTSQNVLPDLGYDAMTRVVANPLPITREVDSDGGTIITIGA